MEDDFDGTKASETISFAFDGVEYAFDLNDAHAGELREVFDRYTKAARKTGSRARPAYRLVRLRKLMICSGSVAMSCRPRYIYWVPEVRGFGRWTRYDFLALSLMIRGVLSPGSETLADR